MSISNSPDLAASAVTIIAPLVRAKVLARDRFSTNADYTARLNSETLASYAECIVLIRSLIDSDMWTARKGKNGPSASIQLQTALVSQATAQSVSTAKAKRLVETSAAILDGNRAIDTVNDAAENNAEAVCDALLAAEIDSEAKLLKHVANKGPKDPVKQTLSKYKNLTVEQRAVFLQMVNKEEDTVTAEAKTETKAEPGKRTSVNNGGAALARRREAKAANGAPKTPRTPSAKARKAAEAKAAQVAEAEVAVAADPWDGAN